MSEWYLSAACDQDEWQRRLANVLPFNILPLVTMNGGRDKWQDEWPLSNVMDGGQDDWQGIERLPVQFAIYLAFFLPFITTAVAIRTTATHYDASYR